MLQLGLRDSSAVSTLWEALTAGELTPAELPEATSSLSFEAKRVLAAVLRLSVAGGSGFKPAWASAFASILETSGWESTRS